MMCEDCGIRPAKFHLMTIINGDRVERNLCPTCMAKHQKQLPGIDFSFDVLKARIREMAFLTKGLKISLKDERGEQDRLRKQDQKLGKDAAELSEKALFFLFFRGEKAVDSSLLPSLVHTA